MTTNDLPEFDVTLKMARKVGALHTDVEYRTFTVRGPAINAGHAEDIAYGLGHGINDATKHEWKFFGGADCITIEPASDEQTDVEQLRAERDRRTAQRDRLAADLADAGNEVDLLTAELAKVRAQLTAANHHTDGLAADDRDNALANEVDALRTQVYAQKPVIEKALTWLEERGTDPNVTPVADLLKAEDALHDAVEQYRLMDLALTTARGEQTGVAR